MRRKTKFYFFSFLLFSLAICFVASPASTVSDDFALVSTYDGEKKPIWEWWEESNEWWEEVLNPSGN